MTGATSRSSLLPTPSAHASSSQSASLVKTHSLSLEPEEGEIDDDDPSQGGVSRSWTLRWNKEVLELHGEPERSQCDKCSDALQNGCLVCLSDGIVRCRNCWIKSLKLVSKVRTRLPLDVLKSISLDAIPITSLEVRALLSLMDDPDERHVVVADVLELVEGMFDNYQEKGEEEQAEHHNKLQAYLLERKQQVATAADVYQAVDRAWIDSITPGSPYFASKLEDGETLASQVDQGNLTDPASELTAEEHSSNAQTDTPATSPQMSSPTLSLAAVDTGVTLHCNMCPARYDGPEWNSWIVPFFRVRGLWRDGDLVDVLDAAKLPLLCEVKWLNAFVEWFARNWAERDEWIRSLLGDDGLWVKYSKHGLLEGDPNEDDTEALGPPSDTICTNCAWAIFLTEIYQWWVDNVRTTSGYQAEEEEDNSGSEADSIDGHSPLASEASSSDNVVPNPGSSGATNNVGTQPDNTASDAVAAVEREAERSYADGEDSGSSAAGTAAESETGFTTDEDLDFEEAVVAVLAATP